MEIGSFIEMQFPRGREYYYGDENIARLNTGRAAIWHALRVCGAKKIWIPVYQCDTVRDFLYRKGVEIEYYRIDEKFNPVNLAPQKNDAVLIVNYFGIMSEERMSDLASNFDNVIIDNSQAFFCPPLHNALSVYSCRKFIGVPDGAYVIGRNAHLFSDEYEQGFSSNTAAFLLLRIEYGCEGVGYAARSVNEKRIDNEDAMRMSKLTRSILDGTVYDNIKYKRRENFKIAHQLFGTINCINPTIYYTERTVPMVYPLVIERDDVIEKLCAAKHFQGHWWSYICQEQPPETFEHWLSRYIIPITIDQRYGKKELVYIHNIIKSIYE